MTQDSLRTPKRVLAVATLLAFGVGLNGIYQAQSSGASTPATQAQPAGSLAGFAGGLFSFAGH